jgi:hypothetical protein
LLGGEETRWVAVTSEDLVSASLYMVSLFTDGLADDRS